MRIRLTCFLFAALFATPAPAAIFAVPEVAPWGLAADLPEGQRGIYADLADAVAQRSLAPITVRFVPYGRMLEGIRSGEFDYAFGLVSPLTSAAAPFTTMIAKVSMMAVARKGLALRSLADLHGFSELAYLRGGSCGAVIEDDPAIHIVGQDSYDLVIRKLAAGRLDGWCGVKAGFVYTLDKSGLADKMGDQLEYGDVPVGMQVTRDKIGTTAAQDVGTIVDSLVKDGTVERIFARYVGTGYKP